MHKICGRILMIFVSSIALQGCVSIRVDGPVDTSDDYLKTDVTFISESKLTIEDHQGTWLSEVTSESFHGATWKYKDVPKKREMSVLLLECEITKGFFEIPYNLFLIFALSPVRTKQCSAIVSLKTIGAREVKVYENKNTYRTFTGPGLIILGWYMLFRKNFTKTDAVLTTLHDHYREMEVPPDRN